MATAVQKFRLHGLPAKAIKNVLGIMDVVDIFVYSLCSKKSANHVSSLNIKASMTKRISQEVLLTIMFNGDTTRMLFRISPEETRVAGIPKLILDKAREILIRYGTVENGLIAAEGEIRRHWRFRPGSQIDIMKFVDHVFSLFQSMQLEHLDFLPGCERYDIFSIKDVVWGPEARQITVWENCENEYHQEIYKEFFPMQSVNLQRNPYPTSKEFQSLISQNFEDIEFSPTTGVTLDDFLVVNSLNASVFAPRIFPEKTVNRFLRLWIRGANPRMRCFAVPTGGAEFHESRFLKGIKYNRAPEGRERYFSNAGRNFMVTGGFDIFTRRGSSATVFLRDGIEQQHFMMVVWD